MAAKKKPVFDFSLCVSCSICVQACPTSCIELSVFASKNDTNLYPKLLPGCMGCGSCERACPIGAVRMEETEA